MEKSLFYAGLVLFLSLIQLTSCQKKICVDSLGESPKTRIPEVRDTLLPQYRMYYAGERRLFETAGPDDNKPKRRVVFRNAAKMPFKESGIIKFYTEIDAMGRITYVATLPETTITHEKSLQQAIQAVFEYRYEPDNRVPYQSGILTITFEGIKI